MAFLNISHEMVSKAVQEICDQIETYFKEKHRMIKVYPIPRGGVPIAYMLQACTTRGIIIVASPEEADCFVDDLVDSGKTRERYVTEFKKPFFAAFHKHGADKAWYIFPWEQVNGSTGIEDNIVRLLEYVGEDPGRPGLLETPQRVAKAWQFWTKGYNEKPEDIFKVFEDGAEGVDQMVMVKDIPFYTHCEHHLAPFFGTATIAYIPDGKIIGLSKLSRLLDMYARRLQVQERLTNQIADTMEKYLQPKGIGVMVRARHLCMESRGICQQGHHTVTNALRGVLLNDPQARAEFMSLADNG